MNDLDMELLSPEYKQWLNELKGRIRSSQLKAAVAVNSALIHFYWELGKSIREKQTQWGSQFIVSLSKDLQIEFPEMKGFSVTNLKYCRQFYQYFIKSPQAGGFFEAEFALRDMKKPMGISEITFVHNLPDDLKSSLPTINELESELKGLD